MLVGQDLASAPSHHLAPGAPNNEDKDQSCRVSNDDIDGDTTTTNDHQQLRGETEQRHSSDCVKHIDAETESFPGSIGHEGSSRQRRDEEGHDRLADDQDIGARDHDDRDRGTDRRSSSPGRHHRDRHSSRDDHHGRSSNHRDRYRDSHDRDKGNHKSSKRRRDYSDDEEYDYDDGRHGRSGRGSRSRHHRRSRSRSVSRRRERSNSPSHSPPTKRNSRTVMVMQLSQRVSTRDLEEFFDDIGQVREVRLIMDSKTRRHKGIAYIEFEDASSATKALALDGKKFMGVEMQIQSALMDKGRREGQHSTTSSSSHDHYHSHRPSNHSLLSSAPTTSLLAPTKSTHPSSRSSNLQPNSYRIYIGGLHVGITDEMLKTIVEPFGQILRIELIKDRTTGASRGYAFVLYANIADGQEAVRCLDGFELAGKHLRVSKSAEKSERPERPERGDH